MADRRVTFHLTIKVIADIEEGISVDDIVSNLDYDINHPGEEATIYDTEIIDFDIIDSK